MLVQALVPWPQLTRSLGGIPDDWVVIRRSMLLSNVEYVPGDVLPKGVIQSRTRIQQLYEQRLIEPLQAPKGSVQQARERMAAKSNSLEGIRVGDTLVAPITKTGNSIGIPFSTEPVAIAEEASTEPVKSSDQSSIQSVLSKVKPSFRRPSLGPGNRSA